MAKCRFLYSYVQIAELAGYKSADAFRRDLSKAKLNIEAVPGSLEIKAPRYDSVQAIRAVALQRLRQMGLPLAVAARYMAALQTEPLSLALDRASLTIFLVWQAGHKHTCRIAVDDAGPLLQVLGSASFIVAINIEEDL